MPAIAGQPPPRYEPGFKLQVIEEALADGSNLTKLADMRNVSGGTIKTWVARHKEIRKLAMKDAAQNGGNGHAPNGHTTTNGHISRGNKPPVLESAAPKKKKGLRVLGLEALIEKLVVATVARLLPEIVKQELGSALKKAFAEKLETTSDR